MEIQKRTLSDGSIRWKVRWRQGGRYRARTFDRKGDATNFAAEVRRRQQVGTLATIDSGRITLAEYVSGTWAKAYRASLSESTRRRYGHLYDKHILPELGPLTLIEITPEVISRWQSDRLAAGGGAVAVRNAATLLGGILQRALESGHLQTNPARAVRKTPLPRRKEVRPLAPIVVERMRAVAGARDATLISVLAYAGLRPGEALALQWRDVREQTILIERALSLGQEDDTKTDAHRTVRLLSPLATDLREWRLRCGRPGSHMPGLSIPLRRALDLGRVPVVAPAGVPALAFVGARRPKQRPDGTTLPGVCRRSWQAVPDARWARAEAVARCASASEGSGPALRPEA